MNEIILLTAAAAPTAEPMDMTGQLLYTFGFAAIMIVLFFFMTRKQRKKDKETKAMRENLQIGDEVTTIGGITGIVVRKTEDTVVIETGGDRNKIRVKNWAISECATKHDAVEEAPKAKKDKTIE